MTLKPIKAILLGFGAVGALGALVGGLKSCGSTIYEGDITLNRSPNLAHMAGEPQVTFKVRYDEGRLFPTRGGFIENRMTLQDGSTTYMFSDSHDRTNLKWGTVPIDRLEHIRIVSPEDTASYYFEDFDPKGHNETIDQVHAQQVFSRSTALYNAVRAGIEKELVREDVEFTRRIPSIE